MKKTLAMELPEEDQEDDDVSLDFDDIEQEEDKESVMEVPEEDQEDDDVSLDFDDIEQEEDKEESVMELQKKTKKMTI